MMHGRRPKGRGPVARAAGARRRTGGATKAKSTMNTRSILSATAVLAVFATTSFGQAADPAAASGGSVFADFSLWSPDVQLAEPTDSVDAFRLAFYGRNADVTGLDVNVAGFAEGDVKGVQLSLGYSQVDGDFYGVQSCWPFSLASWVKGACYGFDVGLVNIVGKELFGFQLGVWNQTGGEATGLQLGVVNVAGSLNGVQAGVVNISRGGYGLQIGLVNFIDGSDVFDVLPFVNFKF